MGASLQVVQVGRKRGAVKAYAVVGDDDRKHSFRFRDLDGDMPVARLGLQPVDDGILHHWLDDQLGGHAVAGRFLHGDVGVEFLSEADALDGQVALDQVDAFLNGAFALMVVHRAAQQFPQLQGNLVDLVFVMHPGQRLDGVQGVEEEMGVHLAFERLAFGFSHLGLFLPGQLQQIGDLPDHPVEGSVEFLDFLDVGPARGRLHVALFDILHRRDQAFDRLVDRAGERHGDQNGDAAADDDGDCHYQQPTLHVVLVGGCADCASHQQFGSSKRADVDYRVVGHIGMWHQRHFGVQSGKPVKSTGDGGVQDAAGVERVTVNQDFVNQHRVLVQLAGEGAARHLDNHVAKVLSLCVVHTPDDGGDDRLPGVRGLPATDGNHARRLGAVLHLGEDVVHVPAIGVESQVVVAGKLVGGKADVAAVADDVGDG